VGWFSIWHWVLAFLFVVVPLSYIAVGVAILARRKPTDPGQSGLGGWMLGVVALQLLLPIPFILGIGDLWRSYEDVKGTLHGPLSVGGQMGINAAALVLVLITLVNLLRRSKHFPALYATQWGVLFLLPAIQFLWEAWALDIEYRQLARFYHFGTVLGALLVAVVGGGAVWYVGSSRRSKNTFVR